MRRRSHEIDNVDNSVDGIRVAAFQWKHKYTFPGYAADNQLLRKLQLTLSAAAALVFLAKIPAQLAHDLD